MNKKILAILIALTLIMVACKKKETAPAGKNATKIETSTNEGTKNPNEVSKLGDSDLEKSNSEKLFQENEDEDSDENNDNLTNKPKTINKEVLKNLMETSDYISRIRVQSTGEEKNDITFLEDYKGDLSSIEISLPKTLAPAKEYLVFYKDSTNGTIEPSKAEESFIEVDGTQDANLSYIESHYTKERVPKIKDEVPEKIDSSKSKN